MTSIWGYFMSKWIYSVFLGNFHLSLNIYQKKSQKLRENARNLKVFGGRLYRWIADNNRPINRPFFHRLIGRLIGIGRTLISDKTLTVVFYQIFI